MNACRCLGRPLAAPTPPRLLRIHNVSLEKLSLWRSGGTSAATASCSDMHHRFFSTDPHQDEPEVVLYQRKTNPSVRLMQSGFAFSSLHTAYWIWYTTDFIPMVNAAQMQDLHVDPAIGWAGICFAASLNFLFYLYPKRLVHKLSYRPDSQKIMVYTHRPPLMRPNIYPLASFPVGKPSQAGRNTDADAKKTTNYLKLNPSSPEALMIVKEYGGDVTRFRGNLKVGHRWPYYNLDIQSPNDVPEPELLMEALLRPEYFGPRNLMIRQEEDEINYDGSDPRQGWNKYKRPRNASKKVGKKARRRR